MSKRNITKDMILEVINSSKSMREASTKLNCHFNTFKKYAIEYDLYKPNQSGKGILKPKEKGLISLTEILEGKHPSYQTYKLKLRLLKANLLDNKCAICGFSGDWNNKPINLILDHINGINHDHKLQNLRLVCPMCDTQLSTFKSKNIKKENKNGI